MKLFSKLFMMFVVVATMGMLQATPAQAAECKGSANAACVSSSTCYWVKGFSRKDGATVKAHCRSKTKEETR